MQSKSSVPHLVVGNQIITNVSTSTIDSTCNVVPYIGNFSRQEILAKMTLGRCVKFSPSPIFSISRTLNEDL